jgi:exportin-1
MAKPEEVLIVTDEHGDAIREPVKDTDGIILYKNMRECLICLTHLDSKNTQEVNSLKIEQFEELE